MTQTSTGALREWVPNLRGDILPAFALPDVPLTLETLRILLPVSLALAAVGLLESLLTAQIVDDMTDTTSPKSREC